MPSIYLPISFLSISSPTILSVSLSAARAEAVSEKKPLYEYLAKFNPDFFIKIGKDVLVVEIKSDEDITEINKAKLKYAEEHFRELNKAQNKFKYYFKFLSPQDFPQFFEAIKKKEYAKYTSNLMAELKSQ